MDIKKTANLLINFAIRRLAEIFGIILFFSGTLIFIALFTYSPDDPNFIFPDNTDYVIGSINSDLTIKLNNYRIVWNYFTSGPNAFGDCYVNGDIECSDLTEFFIFYLRNKEKFDKMRIFFPY